jgi:hypothetical protein
MGLMTSTAVQSRERALMLPSRITLQALDMYVLYFYSSCMYIHHTRRM